MPAILSGLLVHEPDMMVLTEYRNNEASEKFQDALCTEGFSFQAVSHPRKKVNCILITARLPFESVALEELAFDRVRLASARFQRFHLVGVHMPNLKAKIPHWKALLYLAAHFSGHRMIVMGDFNTGRNPHDSQGYRFLCANYMEALEHTGWIDAWRSRHPKGREFSWYSHKGRGFRLDHAFLSPPLTRLLRYSGYDHSFRENGISDHSALILDLAM